MKIITKYALLFVIAAVIYLIVRRSFVSSSPWVIAGQVAALALVVSARGAFGNHPFRVTAEPASGPLLENGPYRFIRHPMYAAALLLIWSSIAGHPHVGNIAVGAVVTVVASLRISAEERLLREHYPEYADYARRTKRLIPFVI